MAMELKRYTVSTHIGEFKTTAASPKKAISNVRFRIFGRKPVQTMYWEVTEEGKKVA